MDPALPDQDPEPDSAPAPELAEEPAHVIWRAAARVNLALDEVLPAGVDPHAYATLVALAGRATRTQQELADTVRVSRTTMVKVAARLVEQGLVTRVRKTGDRRSYALTRTRAGGAAARRWRRHAVALEQALTAGLSPDEQDELRALLLDVVGPELAAETPAPLRGSTSFLVTRLHHRTNRELAVALSSLAIEPRHLVALTVLRARGPMAQVELARAVAVSGARMVQIIDDLERRGLVERRRAATDRRTQLLHLLPEGVRVADRALAVEAEAMASLAPLDPDRTRRLVTLLARVAGVG